MYNIIISYANNLQYLETTERTTQNLANYNAVTSHYSGSGSSGSSSSGMGVPVYEPRFESPDIYCTECRNAVIVDCDL